MFWPFCCKKPQVHIIDGEPPNQWCNWNSFRISREDFAAPQVSGTPNARFVDSPLKFKFLTNGAGIAEDGSLWVWEEPGKDNACIAAETHAAGSRSDVFNSDRAGLVRLGQDTDWTFVDEWEGRYVALKQDGSLWGFGNWQIGTDFGRAPGYLEANIGSQRLTNQFRATISSPIVGFEVNRSVWFRSKPSSYLIRKLRFSDPIVEAPADPGSGAAIKSVEYAAAINDKRIVSVTLTSGGSGYTSAPGVFIQGKDGTGKGAVARAILATGDGPRSVVAIEVVNPGEGYENPCTVSIGQPSSTRATATATATVGIELTSQGSGYTSAPTVRISPAAGGRPGFGTNVEIVKMKKVAISRFDAISGGSGYTAATAIETKTGASANAVISEGRVVGWTMTSGGQALHSPLDTDPLVVTVLGDGEGATAAAVPDGSRVEELAITDNPEVWEELPMIEFIGGGGEGAGAVFTGIIGRVQSVEIESGGDGYTRSGAVAQAYEFRPSLVAFGGNPVGGQPAVGGRVAGGAELGPSPVVGVRRDTEEFAVPPSPSQADSYYDRAKKVWRRCAFQENGTLYAGETGVLFSAFGESRRVGPPGFVVDDEPSLARFYVRGVGHVRYDGVIDTSNTSFPNAVTVLQDIPSPQPPAIYVERPAFGGGSAFSAETFPTGGGEDFDCFGVSVTGNLLWSLSSGLLKSGQVVAAAGGASETRFISGGVFLPYSRGQCSQAPTGGPYPAAELTTPPEYYDGPAFEGLIREAPDNWAQPSDAQRIYLVFAGADGSWEKRAYAKGEIKKGSDTFPEPGSQFELVEAGSGYTREPATMVFVREDPWPVRLSGGWTSVSARGLGIKSGECVWWGENAWLASGRLNGFFVAEDYDLVRHTPGYAAKPLPVGKSLVAKGEGKLTGPISFINQESFYRMPRPQYGNRVADLPVLEPFRTEKSAKTQGEPPTIGVTSYPYGSVVSGIGYAGDASPQYVGPGDYSQDHSITLEARGVEFTDVFQGLAKGTDGKWRTLKTFLPFFADDLPTPSFPSLAPYFHKTSQDGESFFVGSGDCACGFDETFDSVVEVRHRHYYAPVSRRPPTEPADIDFTGLARTQSDGEPFTTVVRKSYSMAPSSEFYYPSIVWRDFIEPPAITFPNGNPEAAEIEVVKIHDSSEPRPFFPIACYDQTKGPPLPGVAGKSASDGLLVLAGGFLRRQDCLSDLEGQVDSIAAGNFTRPWAFTDVGPGPAYRDSYEHYSIGVPLRDVIVRTKLGELLKVQVSRNSEWPLFAPDNAERSSGRVSFFTPLIAFARPPYRVGSHAIAVKEIGSGYEEPVELEFAAPPTVARGTATIDGEVVAIAVVDGGRKFRSPPSVVVAGATATAVIAGPVDKVTVLSGGAGYSRPPRVRFVSPSGVSARATAAVQDGKVVSVTIAPGEGGRYRTAPQVAFDPVREVAEIRIDSAGSGYQSPPSVHIGGGGGEGAFARCEIENGAIKSVTVTSGGSGFVVPPKVVFAGGGGFGAAATAVLSSGGSGAAATATIDGEVIDVRDIVPTQSNLQYPPPVECKHSVAPQGVLSVGVTGAGAGYTSAPTVSFSGGGGSGASATAVISEGRVIAVNVTAPGSSYNEPPLVTLSGGGGSGAAATASLNGARNAVLKSVINGRVISVAVTNPGSGYGVGPFQGADRQNGPRRNPGVRIKRTEVLAKATMLIDGFTPPSVFGENSRSTVSLGHGILADPNAIDGSGISEVIVPKTIISIKVTNEGQGYSLDNPPVVRVVGNRNTWPEDKRFPDDRFYRGNNFSRLSQHLGDPPGSGLSLSPFISKSGKLLSVAVDPRGIYFSSPPQIEVVTPSGQPGGGATAVAVLGHPRIFCAAPQVIFDGDWIADADVGFHAPPEGSSERGLGVERGGDIPKEFVFGRANTPSESIDLSDQKFLATREIPLNINVRADFPRVAGKFLCFRETTPRSELLESSKNYGYFSEPPQAHIEDESGSGAQIAPLANGPLNFDTLAAAEVLSGGDGYTTSATLSLSGGTPEAWGSSPSFSVARAFGRIASVSVSGGPRYTTPPRLIVTGDGDGAQAVAVLNEETGRIVSVKVLSPGRGYTQAAIAALDREKPADASGPVALFLEAFNSRCECNVYEAEVDAPSYRLVPAIQSLTFRNRLQAQIASDLRLGPHRHGIRQHYGFPSTGYVAYARICVQSIYAEGSEEPSATIRKIGAQPEIAAVVKTKKLKYGPVFSATVAQVTEGGADWVP